MRDLFVLQIGSAPIGTTLTSHSRRRTYHIEVSTDSTRTTHQTTTNLAFASPTCRKRFASRRQKLAPLTTRSTSATPSSGESNQEQHNIHTSKQAAEAGQRNELSLRNTLTINIRPTPPSSPTQRRALSIRKTRRSPASPSTSTTPEPLHLPTPTDPEHPEHRDEAEGSKASAKAHCPSRPHARRPLDVNNKK